MKVKVTFDVSNFSIISKCPTCIFNELNIEEYEDLLSLIYVYYCELGHFRDIYEVKIHGKSRKGKKKQRQKDIQKSC